jgi:hypothetical protein
MAKEEMNDLLDLDTDDMPEVTHTLAGCNDTVRMVRVRTRDVGQLPPMDLEDEAEYGHGNLDALRLHIGWCLNTAAFRREQAAMERKQ